MKTPQNTLGCFLVSLIISLVFVGIGGLTVYLVVIGPHFARRAAEKWVATPCEVLECRLVEHDPPSMRGSARTSPSYELVIKYRYQFNEQEYVSDRYDVYEISTGEKQWKEDVVRQTPPGTLTTCFVDPSNPARAVISREQNIGYLTALLAVPFFVFGFVGIFVTRALYPMRAPAAP